MSKQDLSFEDSMKKLEEIANELESGKLTLEESVDKFEEGMKISKICNEILENAEKKISIITSENGDIEEKDFSVE